MESVRDKVDKVVELVQDRNLDTKEAIELVRNYDLDNNGQLYDADTGETICDIELATDEQIRILLQTEKDPLQRVQK
ncbi:conserved hypothetical protein [Clostridiaceae bacterium BL-3]|jgi:hypothetical protein|nr:conserved hypothetical protein [Clostridiaceae bacterium BL-3]